MKKIKKTIFNLMNTCYINTNKRSMYEKQENGRITSLEKTSSNR